MIELRPGIEMGSVGVEIRHPVAMGDGYLFTWMFEGLGGASFLFPWDVLHPAWNEREDGSLGYDMNCIGNSEHPLGIRVRLKAASEHQLDMEATLINPSERTYSYCWADMCLMFKHAPAYADQRGERCLLHGNQGLVTVEKWPRRVRSDAWSPVVQAYQVEGFDVPYPYGVVQGLALWSESPRPVKSSCIMMARDDHRWHIGYGWDRAASVAHNPDDEHHCIHSEPWFGTVPPEGRITRRGVLLFVEGSAEDLLDRYLEWTQSE